MGRQNEYTTVRIKTKDRDRIASKGKKSESFDEIIERILDYNDKCIKQKTREESISKDGDGVGST